jgi:hypothetical protein
VHANPDRLAAGLPTWNRRLSTLVILFSLLGPRSNDIPEFVSRIPQAAFPCSGRFDADPAFEQIKGERESEGRRERERERRREEKREEKKSEDRRHMQHT